MSISNKIIIKDHGSPSRGAKTQKHDSTKNNHNFFPTEATSGQDSINFELEDIAYVRQMKEKFLNGQLDLLLPKNFKFMIDVYEKEVNKKMIKKVL
jgi:hypothetical protein